MQAPIANQQRTEARENAPKAVESAHDESLAVLCSVGARSVLEQQADERRRLVLDGVRRVFDKECERVDDMGSQIEFRQLERAQQERQELWQFGDDSLLRHALQQTRKTD